MKALSVRQPWAGLIASGRKKIELRSWATPYRGPLAIHAGLTVARAAALELKVGASECQPRGVILCVVDLVDIRPADYRYDGRGTFSVASWEWVLKRPRRVAPVAVSGKLGLFELGDLKLRYQ